MQAIFNVFVPLKEVQHQIDRHYTPQSNADTIFQMSIEGAIEKRLNRDKISTGGAGAVFHLIPKDQRLSKDKLKVYAAAMAAVFGGDKIGVEIALDPLFDGTVSRHIVSLSNAEARDEYQKLAEALKSIPARTSFEYVEEFLNSLDADEIAIWITINFDPNQTIDISDRDFVISGAEQSWAMQGLESAIRFAAGLGSFNAGLFPGTGDFTWHPKISMPTGLTFCLPQIHPGTLEIGENGRVTFLALFKASEEDYGFAIPAPWLRRFRTAKWSLDKKGVFTMRQPIGGAAAGTVEFKIAPAPDDNAEA